MKTHPKTLLLTFAKSVLTAIFFLTTTYGNSLQAQSVTETLKGTWEVKSWYCNNFLSSKNSRCPANPSSPIGKTYEFAFSPTGDGKIKLGDYYYPFDMTFDNDKLAFVIDMKMFQDTWYIVEFSDRLLRVSFFNSEISVDDGSQSFNGDFNVLTLVKKD